MTESGLRFPKNLPGMIGEVEAAFIFGATNPCSKVQHRDRVSPWLFEGPGAECAPRLALSTERRRAGGLGYSSHPRKGGRVGGGERAGFSELHGPGPWARGWGRGGMGER